MYIVYTYKMYKKNNRYRCKVKNVRKAYNIHKTNSYINIFFPYVPIFIFNFVFFQQHIKHSISKKKNRYTNISVMHKSPCHSR